MITKKVEFKDDLERAQKKAGKMASADQAKAEKSLVRSPRAGGGGRGGSRPKGYRLTPTRKPPMKSGEKRKILSQLFDYLREGDKSKDGREYPNGKGRIDQTFSINGPGIEDFKSLNKDELARTESWFKETACLNKRSGKSPALHYVFSLPPEDGRKAKGDLWQETAKRALEALDLQGHHALACVHKDTDIPHMHLVINRVNPITERSADPFRDLIRLEKLNRQIEKDYFLSVVPGCHIDPDTLDYHDWSKVDKSKVPDRRPRKNKIATEIKINQAKKALVKSKPFTKATSWPELDQKLKEHGYNLERKGRGLVLVDNEGEQIKVSRVAGKAGNREALESRFGQNYETYLSEKEQNDKARKAGFNSYDDMIQAQHQARQAKMAERIKEAPIKPARVGKGENHWHDLDVIQKALASMTDKQVIAWYQLTDENIEKSHQAGIRSEERHFIARGFEELKDEVKKRGLEIPKLADDIFDPDPPKRSGEPSPAPVKKKKQKRRIRDLFKPKTKPKISPELREKHRIEPLEAEVRRDGRAKPASDRPESPKKPALEAPGKTERPQEAKKPASQPEPESTNKPTKDFSADRMPSPPPIVRGSDPVKPEKTTIKTNQVIEPDKIRIPGLKADKKDFRDYAGQLVKLDPETFKAHAKLIRERFDQAEMTISKKGRTPDLARSRIRLKNAWEEIQAVGKHKGLTLPKSQLIKRTKSKSRGFGFGD